MSVLPDVVYESFDADLSVSCDAQSLVYVTGYVSFKVISKVECMQCRDNLRQDRIMHVDNDIIMFGDNLRQDRIMHVDCDIIMFDDDED